jgi:hypothetical protein
MLVSAAEAFISNVTEGFNDNSNKRKGMKGRAGGAIGFVLLVILILVILMLLFSKFLWNSCAVPLLNLPKCDSVWKIIGLSLLLGIILPQKINMPQN